MNSTNNNSFEIAAKKVFSDLYVLIKEDEKETEYKIDNKKTDDKNEIDNKNAILIKPNIWNTFKSNNSLDCIKEYINKDEKFNKINCHSFQTIFKVNTNFNLTSFNIKILDKNGNKIGYINSSCKVYFKHEDKDREEFLCNNECQCTMNNINNEIKNYTINFKCKQDDKPKQINVLDSRTDISKDDKPVNLLDLDNDILNIIGDFVKKDNKRREIQELKDEEQIINGRKIIFPFFCSSEILKTINTKETLKEYIFNYINREFHHIKKYANILKIRLSKDDKRKCAWVLFKRCKIIIDRNKVYYNIDAYNMDDNEEKDFFMEYLKLKNLSLPKNTTFEY